MKPLFLAVLLASAAFTALAQRSSGRQVDDQLLREGSRSGDEWVSYAVNWSEQRFSPLNQINVDNVRRLGLAWSYDIPAAPGNHQTHQEGTPLVFNGVLYSIAPWSVVYAVDVRTGKELWHQDPDVNQQVWQSRICCGIVNRGIALYKGKVIAPVVDGRLRALDASTGKLLWETRVSPETQPYTITMAPRVIKGGKVIIGVSGGEYGIRGFFSAYDVQTGKLAWRFYTVPGDPSKPFEHPDLAAAAKTWSGQWYKIGGGAAVWNGMAYDPDADIVYIGTGQPGPWTDVARGPGDNLYANCILAVRGATGRLVWYYQEVPGDDWDYDSIADLMLANLTIDGKPRKVIMHAPKDGFFYVLDRLTGQLISADPFTKVSWAKGIDLKTGRPIVNPEARYGTAKPVRVMPGPAGGHVWAPWSYNPFTGLVYIPGTSGTTYSFQANADFVPAPTEIGPTGRGQFNMGTATGGRGGRARGGNTAQGNAAQGSANANLPPEVAAATPAARPDAAGIAAPGIQPPSTVSDLATIGPDGATGNVLFAWDPIARKERWRAANASPGPFSGGTLATAGNLVFSSNNDKLLVFRADTGEKLLELSTGLTQLGPPISFMIDGKQYITVAGGPKGGNGGGPNSSPSTNARPAHLLAFVLDGKAPLPDAKQ
ncbi:MAG TPA: PQQ-binding-like beta-propeller repeat protein [Bryobacteraceae bacterium]|nr:PQQ-binding-like beta-propeller repeat protein [Bryobacteraceae bacterium]